MPDRKQVIKAIEACMDQNHPAYCNECYLDGPGFGIVCREKLMRDALALLREQEPVEPENENCPECGYTLHRISYDGPDKGLRHEWFRFCPSCGRAVAWNG